MVSLNTVITLGVLGAIVAGFYGLGGAKGIGERIGSGLSSFGQAFQSGISSSLIPTVTTPTTPSNLDLKKLEETGIAQGTRLDQLNQQTMDNFGGKITSEQVIVNAEKVRNPDEKIISTEFKEAVQAGVITPNFAEKYSFQPPVKTGQLDVSRTFDYIARPTKFITPTQASRNEIQKAKSNYGGYGSSINQSTALAQAIAQSARDNPSYFG